MFTSRLQPIQIGLGSSATSQNLSKLNFDYGGIDNNGNVKSQTITTPTVGNVAGFTATQNYAYDSLNRLKSAFETIGGNQTWKQTYNFDKYGNRRFDTTNNLTTTLQPERLPKVVNPEALTSNNRLKPDQDGDNVVDYLYDASGNLTKDVDNKRFGYDAENKQVQYFASNNQTITPTGAYFFDGDGKRVKKISPTETTIFVYDAGGKLVAEYSTKQADTPKINYTTNDHLGSPRITTDQNGQVISRTDYQPYGEEIASTQRTSNLGYTVQDSVKQGFTGYIKDDETDLDFAQARMYKTSLGRFTGADPMLTSGEISSPQTWNRYSYVSNNPLIYIDSLGLYRWSASLGGNLTDEELRTNLRQVGQDENLSPEERDEQSQQIVDQLNGRQTFRDALSALITASSDVSLAQNQRDDVLRSRNAYGIEGQDVGTTRVMVGVGNLGAGVGATTEETEINTGADGRFTGSTIEVTIGLSLAAKDLAQAVGHEGSHVADQQAANNIWLTTGNRNLAVSNALNVTKYATENRAYHVSASIAQSQGRDNLSFSDKGKSFKIWGNGMTNVDQTVLDGLLNSHYNVTPTNQGVRRIQ